MTEDCSIQSLLDISEELAPLPLARLAGQSMISFSRLLDPPLILHEDLKDGCGGQKWPAGMLLARYLLTRLDELRGKTVSAATPITLNILGS